MNPLPIVVTPVAQEEFDDAGDWYEQCGAGLGARFTQAVQDVFDRIAATPQMHKIVVADIRKAVVRGFPYIVLYREEPGQLVVIAVFHTSRDPAEWQGHS